MIQARMWPKLPPAGLGPILASIKCDYKVPLTYPDTVHIGTRVPRIGNSSFRMDHVIVSHKTGVVAAEIESTLVILDYAIGKPARVPEEMRRAIAAIEGHGIIEVNDTP
jgi:acyl-CoA thioester hydrolase